MNVEWAVEEEKNVVLAAVDEALEYWHRVKPDDMVYAGLFWATNISQIQRRPDTRATKELMQATAIDVDVTIP